MKCPTCGKEYTDEDIKRDEKGIERICPHLCQDCKHCEKIDGGLTCDSPKTKITYNLDRPPNGGILVENDEGWGIIVSPTFGCRNWESK